MSSFLARAAANSGGVCSLSSVGKSVQGRELWLITAGDPAAPTFPDPAQPQVPYPKPKFAYIGNMHGDEQANLLVVLQLVDELCSQQRSSDRAREVLQGTTLYIIPSMNPDGLVAADRFNANGVDLNRNCFTGAFPYAPPSPLNTTAAYPEARYFLSTSGWGMEPETLAVTSWLMQLRPAASANLHGGALVASYALDACDSLASIMNCDSPEKPLPYLLAQAYAQNNPQMRDNFFDSDGVTPFDAGTTQGAAWYTALGTLGDWAHWSQHLHMLTLELYVKKRIDATDNMTALYAANRDALFRLAEMSHLGWRARLLDGQTGAPLRATVQLDGPGGMWAPQVEPGGYIWKLGYPGTQYVGTVYPYDPNNPSVSYMPIPFSFAVPLGPYDVVHGRGLSGLSAVQTLFAQRK